ncbi:hypothetical protein [Geomonas subterranea]|uniref:SPW repeat-containing protein n=1 Tax=Geomonas subterranea TaxID=2847989 RepID=A0ABX8LDS3_9BACT|nr:MULTISPECIES: hypothetical protein [Geomonas]QXE90200.1 hypothetical protein KP001_17535 [Geomonas subterranea]QXM07674.1 hypothetical protein KP002_11745 [Geomonas subterranea]
MKTKMIGVALGVAGVVLWFMPMAKVGINVYVAGREVGNISYILVVCSLAYAIFSFFELHKLRVIAATVSTAISLLFLTEAWSNAAWGLYGLGIVSIASWIAAATCWDAAKDSVQDTQG